MKKRRKPQQLERTVIYTSDWINVYKDKVRLPSGRILPEHHVVTFQREAVAAVVEDDAGRILMVNAYRYVTDSLSWELPAGGIEENESIIEAARREVREETGYETINHEHIYRYYPTNGISNHVFHFVSCKASENGGSFDEDEISEVKWFTMEEINNLIYERKLDDGYTLSGLLLHMYRKNRISK